MSMYTNIKVTGGSSHQKVGGDKVYRVLTASIDDVEDIPLHHTGIDRDEIPEFGNRSYIWSGEYEVVPPEVMEEVPEDEGKPKSFFPVTISINATDAEDLHDILGMFSDVSKLDEVTISK